MKKHGSQSRKSAAVIWTLKVECVFGANFSTPPCVRVIEIPEDASLDDLHLAIQAAVRFDDDHPHGFYAGRRPFRRKVTYAEQNAVQRL